MASEVGFGTLRTPPAATVTCPPDWVIPPVADKVAPVAIDTELLFVKLPLICVDALMFTVPVVLLMVPEIKSLATVGTLEAEVVSVPVFVSVPPIETVAVEVLPPITFRFPPLVKFPSTIRVPSLLVGCSVIVWPD
jgi:hypothetical protein